MHRLVELPGQPGWVAALTPLSVDGMIVAASTTLLAGSAGGCCGYCWRLAALRACSKCGGRGAARCAALHALGGSSDTLG